MVYSLVRSVRKLFAGKVVFREINLTAFYSCTIRFSTYYLYITSFWTLINILYFLLFREI